MIGEGSLEALKWLALVLMAGDHANRYLLGSAWVTLFELGRMAMPLFGFVLMSRLARPGAWDEGVHRRVMVRLLLAGAVATPFFVALHGSAWQLNILFTLLAATAIAGWLERGGALHVAAALLVLGGAVPFVEFGAWGLLTCLGAWAFCRRPTRLRLALWVVTTASLWMANGNAAALAALPLIWCAAQVHIPLRPMRWFFYGFYPVHLALLLCIQRFC